MRLAIVCPGDSPHAVPWVEAFIQAGHEVLVYAYPPASQAFPGATVRVVSGRGPVARGRWLRTAVMRDQPDVLSLHYVSTDAFVLSRLGRPFIASAWGSDILRDLERSPVKRALVLSALRRAALVVSPAGHMTDRLVDSNVDEHHIRTCQYGVDVASIRQKRHTSPPPVVVVSTRALSPLYRVDDLVRAVPLLRHCLISEVRIMGDGPMSAELAELADQLDVGDRVSFAGRLGPPDLLNELRRADIYVSTSESDGASLSLLEAMASGLPCVVTDIPANREWIDEACGTLVPVGDPRALAGAVSRLAGDLGMRQMMGAEARRRVEERGDRRVNMRRIVMAVETVAAVGVPQAPRLG